MEGIKNSILTTIFERTAIVMLILNSRFILSLTVGNFTKYISFNSFLFFFPPSSGMFVFYLFKQCWQYRKFRIGQLSRATYYGTGRDCRSAESMSIYRLQVPRSSFVLIAISITLLKPDRNSVINFSTLNIGLILKHFFLTS